MIFITVGTARFDPLIAGMDRLVGAGVIRDRVVAQIGRGSYEPKNIRYFRWLKSLQKAYEHAEIIVSAGGAKRRRAQRSLRHPLASLRYAADARANHVGEEAHEEQRIVISE